VLFVEGGMISLLTAMSDGAAIENATLGREAILGSLGALGTHHANMRALVQIPVTGWRMRAADLRTAAEKSRQVRRLALRSTELLQAQLQQTAACNALHSAERRLCRWISQARDRVDSDTIQLTQDFLAQMLAVRRPTVTLIAQGLQNAGLISYRRGRIDILDRQGLERRPRQDPSCPGRTWMTLATLLTKVRWVDRGRWAGRPDSAASLPAG
jgi:CRP-like cAMP-binding protein